MKREVAILLSAVALYGAGHNAHAHGDLHEQIVAISKTIKADPKNALLLHKRGELHRAHGDYAEALQDYAEAEKLAPGLDVIFLSRGRTLFESGKPAPAFEAVNAFLSRQPDHLQAKWLRGQIQVKLGRRNEAENDFREVLKSVEEVSPDQILERAKNLQENDRAKEALAAIVAGINQLGPLITLELAALDLEVALKDYSAALKRLNILIEGAERKETYLVRKAEVLEKMGDSVQAEECYRKALEAIGLLPQHLRKVKSVTSLETTIRTKLSSLQSPQAGKKEGSN